MAVSYRKWSKKLGLVNLYPSGSEEAERAIDLTVITAQMSNQ
jgi:hypothetical protein